MGEQHQIAGDFVEDRAAATTDPVLNLTNGLTFSAEIDGSPDPIRVATELSEDAREVVLLHVSDNAQAESINQGDQVKFKLFGVNVVCRVLRRVNSPANPQIDFWAQKIVPGKDA
jgi:hypothetical protein